MIILDISFPREFNAGKKNTDCVCVSPKINSARYEKKGALSNSDEREQKKTSGSDGVVAHLKRFTSVTLRWTIFVLIVRKYMRFLSNTDKATHSLFLELSPLCRRLIQISEMLCVFFFVVVQCLMTLFDVTNVNIMKWWCYSISLGTIPYSGMKCIQKTKQCDVRPIWKAIHWQRAIEISSYGGCFFGLICLCVGLWSMSSLRFSSFGCILVARYILFYEKLVSPF